MHALFFQVRQGNPCIALALATTVFVDAMATNDLVTVFALQCAPLCMGQMKESYHCFVIQEKPDFLTATCAGRPIRIFGADIFISHRLASLLIKCPHRLIRALIICFTACVIWMAKLMTADDIAN